MSPLTVVNPRIIKGFIFRNGYLSNDHVAAQWLRFLEAETGQLGYMHDLEKLWLRALGARGDTLHDLWTRLLTQEGFEADKLGMRKFFEQWPVAAPATGGMPVPALAALWTLE